MWGIMKILQSQLTTNQEEKYGKYFAHHNKQQFLSMFSERDNKSLIWAIALLETKIIYLQFKPRKKR